MLRISLRILGVHREIVKYPQMKIFGFLHLASQLRFKRKGEIIRNPDVFLQHLLKNFTLDCIKKIFYASYILVETLTQELDCQNLQISFGTMMHQKSIGSRDPRDLPPNNEYTTEIWNIVGNLHLFYTQMLAPPIRHFLPRVVTKKMVKPVISKTFHLRCLTNGQNPRLKRIVLSPGLVSCFWREMRKLAILLKQDPGNRIARYI